MTDANLFLGRLLPDFFPKIFGKNEDEGLDVEASEKLLKELTEQINKETGKNMTADEVAFGFLTVANETMTRPIRSLTEAKGHDTSKHRLATFGGAGGQHAVAIAESLGIRQTLVHRYSSVLSAYGMVSLLLYVLTTFQSGLRLAYSTPLLIFATDFKPRI